MIKPTSKNPISETPKENLKEAMNEGAYDLKALEIVPSGVHTKADLDDMVAALKAGKAYVFDGKATRNTSYNIRKRLRDEYKLKGVKFGHVKATGQSVIYLS